MRLGAHVGRLGRTARAPAAALMVAVGLGTAACDITVDTNQAMARVEKSFTVAGNPDVTLATFDGSVEVRAWDRPEVVVQIEKRGRSQAAVDAIEVKTEQRGNQISVEARRPSNTGVDITFGRSPSAKIIASVPRQANVVAQSGDGSISIERVTGRVELRTGDGSVNARDLAGDLTAHSGDGSISVNGFEGRAAVETADGSVQIEGRLNGLRAETGDGSVTIRARDGSAAKESWSVSTGDGSLRLDLPAQFDADLDAYTGDGHVVAPGDLKSMLGSDRRSLKGKIGAGGQLLKLHSGSGTIEIRKG